jgi:hypothetical protein
MSQEESPVVNQGLRVLINTIVSHQASMIPLLEVARAEEFCVSMLKITDNVVMHFTLNRLLFYMCLNKDVAKSLATLEFYQTLFRIFLLATDLDFEKNDDKVRSASECLKVLFLLHSECAFNGDRELYDLMWIF